MARLLVVDEDEDVRDSLARLFEMWGHDAAPSGDGTEALAITAAWRPDVIVVHLGLPGEPNGWELVRTIRIEQGWRPFIIAMTGWAREERRVQALAAGANVILVKPADIDHLRRLIDDAVEKQKRATRA